MMRSFEWPYLTSLALVLLLAAESVTAAGGSTKLMHMDVDLADQDSLLRGAKTFTNYCFSCHSAAYMRYNRMGDDLGIAEDVLKANFIFSDQKVGDLMTIAMSKEDGVRYFGVAPPDLSVTARSRGSDWLYTYLKTFYIDESRPFGVNNLVLKNASMPHVLWELQGMQRLVPQAGPASYEHLELVSAGTQTEAEYDRTIKDLVNFMVYLGEPIKLKRTKIGTIVILYLLLLLVVAYLLKKEYWRDVK